MTLEARLRDGSRVLIRPIEPDDRRALARGFERLSETSRYRRFLTPMRELSASQLRYLTEVDHRGHEALIAFDPDTQEAIGVARYVREPDTSSAESAVTVADDWQGRGLGTELTRLLAARALEEGIERFSALLLADNEEMMDLLADVGSVEVTRRDAETVEVEVPLRPPSGASESQLRGVLRTVASTPVDLAAAPGERDD